MSKVALTDKEKAKRKKVFITVLTIVGAISFLGSTSYGMVEIMRKGMDQPVKTATQDPAATKNTELQARAKGYETVLQREPNNLVALEGLAMAKIELNDLQGAIAPLEKLAQLAPNNSIVLERLAAAKIEVNDVQGAIVILEKLVQLDPNNPNYKSILEKMKQGATQPKEPSK